MAFVRVKNIKGKPYAYLVENEWTPWGSRQKVTKYLGRAHELNKIDEHGFPSLPPDFSSSILHAVVWELLNHGFEPNGTSFVKESITVDLQNKSIRQKGKLAVLGMNEGFLCDHTLQQLLAFLPEESHNATATKLAQIVLEAGLKLPQERFVQLFEILQ